MRRDRDDAVAVAIHDVEPATYARAALIRDWLDDHGIDRVTLLVVPAPDLHPFSTSSPELAEWLLERADRGDAIAQHGLTCRGTEFARLGHEEARRAVDSGRRLLKLAGMEPLGFVAPGYAYTPALRAGALLCGPLLRIDLRPTDLDHTRHMLALERVLRRARRRTAVTYDELAAA
jgi:predicted deacetylase